MHCQYGGIVTSRTLGVKTHPPAWLLQHRAKWAVTIAPGPSPLTPGKIVPLPSGAGSVMGYGLELKFHPGRLRTTSARSDSSVCSYRQWPLASRCFTGLRKPCGSKEVALSFQSGLEGVFLVYPSVLPLSLRRPEESAPMLTLC